ncbi:17-beta-hydroxysteroid dehydrogenase 14 [Microtus ochrogaster]|uniref:Dehydrogenase/reductase SDR family member 4 n=1 Tax=Microtus ochrogaster TaxID=79684 RepID=A0A8J6G6Y7_MICOH|nr:17-beta-hydroxysteroid dehydrogenase 14 [Microtus ochrogaster]
MAAVPRYSGKVVVVTGGARGIGAGIVRAFVDSGAQVVFCDKDEAGGRALEQELSGTVFVRCDVTQEGDLQLSAHRCTGDPFSGDSASRFRLFYRGSLGSVLHLSQTLISETLSRFGHLDCVVNNAGYHPPAQWPEETSAQDFRQLLELNLLGTYTLTKLALPHLRKRRGNIINISSLVGTIGQSQAVTYVATKGAVTAMTKALALDESRYGVRVNCISPGNIWTPLWEELAASTSDPSATILEGTLAQPLGRMGQPAEVGAAAVFLASEATFCTGLELLVTGGAELGYGRKSTRSSLVETPSLPP